MPHLAHLPHFPVTVEWVTSPTQMDSFAEEWEALAASVHNRTVFSTCDFLTTWYHNYAGEYGGETLIGVARRDGILAGIAPLVVRVGRMGRIPITRVHFAMHDAYSGEFLLDDAHPDIAGEFVEALARGVGFDIICLNGIEPDSDCFQAVEAAAARRHLAIEMTDHPNAVVDLSGGYDAYCRAMSGNFRRTLKRQRQRIATAGEPMVDGVRLATGVDRVEDAIARLFAVTEASYKLRGERLADRHRNYLAELARRFAPRGMLHLSILSLGGRDAAVVMGLVERGCYYDVTLAYAEEFATLSPGAYLMQEVLRDLAESGVHTAISHGAHEYKRRWATRFVPSTRTFLFAPRAKATATRFIRFGLRPLWARLGADDP